MTFAIAICKGITAVAVIGDASTAFTEASMSFITVFSFGQLYVECLCVNTDEDT